MRFRYLTVRLCRGSDGVDVHQCAHVACGLFFHTSCVNDHELTKKKSKTRGANRGNFICPHHACAQCKQQAHTALLVQCNRCVDSYHIDCMPPGVTVVNARSIVCPRHDSGASLDAFAPETSAKVDDPWEINHVFDHMQVVRPALQTIRTANPMLNPRLPWRATPAFIKHAFSSVFVEAVQLAETGAQ